MTVIADQDARRIGTIWALGLDETPPVIAPLTPATFFRVEASSAPELNEAMGGEVLAEILQRFETGRRCYAARVDGRLAVYGWVSFDEEFVGELKLFLRLLPGEAYIWNCATLPAFQQKRLYSALLLFIAQELQREKCSRAWIGADFDNLLSQRGIVRAGFTYVADLLLAGVLPLRQFGVVGQPGVPDGLVAEARRVFLS